MTHITENDIERILKTKPADLGLFVLAIHSLMERALREKYDSTSGFGILIDRYTDEYKLTYGTPIYTGAKNYKFPKDKQIIFDGLKKIYTNHYLSNNVRHEFIEISDENAKSTVVCFLAFAAAEGWTNLKTIKNWMLSLITGRITKVIRARSLKKPLKRSPNLNLKMKILPKRQTNLMNFKNNFLSSLQKKMFCGRNWLKLKLAFLKKMKNLIRCARTLTSST